ncbi:CDP-diacylglycerol--glycerol-3-phosphate 3-phosphatidyltransferase [Paenibacillus marinisediminis]
MNLANKITIARIGLIPLFMLCYQSYPAWMVNSFTIVEFMEKYGVYLAVALFVIASVTDKLDGYVARKYNQITNLGKLLDPLADKLLISAAFILLVQHQYIPSWIAFVIIGREVVVTALRSVASAKGIALAADRYGKWKLVIQVVAVLAVMLNESMLLPKLVVPIDYYLMLAAVAITVFSGVNYIKNNYKRLEINHW